MRAYDPNEPLIFIHVPKTAGGSVRDIVRPWFAQRFIPHYYNRFEDRLPPRRDLDAITARSGGPPLIFGHFNKSRGFGIEDYYPDVRQFVTILRNPFDMHISRYHFARRKAQTRPIWNDVGNISLEDHILEGELNMLEHFPRTMTRANYREIIDRLFVDIGCVEVLEESLARIATLLGKTMPANAPLPRHNVTLRDEEPAAHLRDAFRDRFPLEHEIYDHVRAMQPDRVTCP